jgi:uncharacterized protein YbjQ (UPF0145 family)
MRAHALPLVLAATVAGCAHPPRRPAVTYATRAYANPFFEGFEGGGGDAPPPLPAANARAPALEMNLTTTRERDVPSEVVGIVEVDESRRDAALELLRERAVGLGADGVVGIEVRPSGLRGLAVRQASSAAPQGVSVRLLLGQLVCASEVVGLVEVGEDEGLDALRLRGKALGAEAVAGVELAGARLRGTAVRCHDLVSGSAVRAH